MIELSESEAEADVVRQLRQLAGAADDSTSFVFTSPDGPTVEARYFGGSGSNVTLIGQFGFAPSARAPGGGHYRASGEPLRATRPMLITLREEDDADRDAKEEGVSREFQTGDARFDARVYIDTTTPDAVLRDVFASSALRDAALALFDEGVRAIALDDREGRVTTTLFTFSSRTHDERRAERLVRAFEQLVRSTPRVVDSGEPAPADREGAIITVISAIALLLFMGGIPLFFALAPSRCWVSASDGDGSSLTCAPVGCCDPIAPGLALGTALAFVLWFVAPRFIRGRSDSHRRRSTVGLTSALLGFELSMFAMAIYYWGLRSR